MPSLSSTLTSTLTLIVTLTSASPQNIAITSSIRGLSDCAQGVLFPLLANSMCNPANFPCICTELDRLGASGAVGDTCSESEFDQFENFEINTCGQQIAVQPPTLNLTNLTSTTVVVPTVPISTGIINVTSATLGPFNNATVVPIASATTNVVVLPTVGPNGEPSSFTTEIVGPVTPTGASEPTEPSGPSFTGAAAVVDVPEFGKGRMGLMAGAMGFMGLVFAEL